MTNTAMAEAEVMIQAEPVRPRRRRFSKRIIAGQVALYAMLVVLALIYIYPFLVQVATSFKTDAEAAADPISLIPSVFTVAAYELLFTRSDFPLWFMNSAIVTICVTLGRVFFVSLAGYALARLHFRGRSGDLRARRRRSWRCRASCC